jgi:hypothetical protein
MSLLFAHCPRWKGLIYIYIYIYTHTHTHTQDPHGFKSQPKDQLHCVLPWFFSVLLPIRYMFAVNHATQMRFLKTITGHKVWWVSASISSHQPCRWRQCVQLKYQYSPTRHNSQPEKPHSQRYFKTQSPTCRKDLASILQSLEKLSPCILRIVLKHKQSKNQVVLQVILVLWKVTIILPPIKHS